MQIVTAFTIYKFSGMPYNVVNPDKISRFVIN
jgi:hypothetical protein